MGSRSSRQGRVDETRDERRGERSGVTEWQVAATTKSAGWDHHGSSCVGPSGRVIGRRISYPRSSGKRGTSQCRIAMAWLRGERAEARPRVGSSRIRRPQNEPAPDHHNSGWLGDQAGCSTTRHRIAAAPMSWVPACDRSPWLRLYGPGRQYALAPDLCGSDKRRPVLYRPVSGCKGDPAAVRTGNRLLRLH